MVTLSQIQEIPARSMILLVGPPGSGKSTFCHQTVLSNIEARPVIYVSTEAGPSSVIKALKEKGLGRVVPNPLVFIDAFHKTVGLKSVARPDTVHASIEDLTSLSVAISKLQEQIGKRGVLLVFDSLTAPYLMNGSLIVRFLRFTISKFVAEGNAVLACVDEGCGKSEDLIAMMSSADGIVKITLSDNMKTFNIVKHPRINPTTISIHVMWSPLIPYHLEMEKMMQHITRTMGLQTRPLLRTEVGDYVHLFWMNLARWSAMTWDPKRFPTMIYYSNKYTEAAARDFSRHLPWPTRLFLKVFMPKDFSRVKDMKKVLSWFRPLWVGDRDGIPVYLDQFSTMDEHYLRVNECAICWGLENVGAALHLGVNGSYAGALAGFEQTERAWNIVASKCIGRGDAYCELKIVPAEIPELQASLESINSTIVEKIHHRLIQRLKGFILHNQSLWKERPMLGNMVGLHAFSYALQVPAMASERYRIAIRLGGAVTGKKIGEHLIEAGMGENDAITHIFHLLEHCKVGKMTVNETIRMIQNCESILTKSEEPSCHFTTGFFNGFFSAVKNQHVREVRCIAMGDPYCEWEFR